MSLLFGTRRYERAPRRNGFDTNGGKAYRAVFTASIIAVLIGIIFLVYNIAGGWTTVKSGFMLASFFVSVSCLICLPWVRKIEMKQWQKTAIGFIIATIVCAVLWVIADFWLMAVIRGINASNVNEGSVLSMLSYLKTILIVTLQLGIGSFVANQITQLKNRLLVFQIISYASILIIDIWLILLAFAIQIETNPENINDFLACFHFNAKIGNFIFNNKVWPLLLIAAIFATVAVSISGVMERRRIANMAEKATEDIVANAKSIANTASNLNQGNDPKSRLEKLESMYSSGLITKEEYERKRLEIINNM